MIISDGVGCIWITSRAICFSKDTGNDPREFTKKNIQTFKRQIKELGFSYDWDREVNTTDPEYYKWTQWIFIQLYNKGLAYVDEVAVNWCPALGTVLSNEEVIDGLNVVDIQFIVSRWNNGATYHRICRSIISRFR